MRNLSQTDSVNNAYQNDSGPKPKNFPKTIRQAPALVPAIIRFATKHHENRQYQIMTCSDGDSFAQKMTDDILKGLKSDKKRMRVLVSVNANGEIQQ